MVSLFNERCLEIRVENLDFSWPVNLLLL